MFLYRSMEAGLQSRGGFGPGPWTLRTSSELQATVPFRAICTPSSTTYNNAKDWTTFYQKHHQEDMSDRITRSQSRQPSQEPTTANLAAKVTAAKPKEDGNEVLHISPAELPKKLKTLTPPGRALLLAKQIKLRDLTAQIPTFIIEQQDKKPELAQAAAATLVFAQAAAGTAICISPSGHILTCAHCIAEDSTSYSPRKVHWLLFSSGDIVLAKCSTIDFRRDVALLQITASTRLPPFPFISIAATPPKLNSRLLCIGHPGSEDLEADTSGIETGYDVLHISEGKFRGMQPGVDEEDNSEIGALRHDCWTYWGHSGAPLILRDHGGGLVGLHSSWDDETGMRRGVGWKALKRFLEGAGRLIED